MSNVDHNITGQLTLSGLETVTGYQALDPHLSPAQETVCNEYVLNGGNIGRAYLKAYPKSKSNSAVTNGSRLLKTARIQRRIQELKIELARRHSVTAADVVAHLAAVLRYDRREFLDEEGRVIEPHRLESGPASIMDLDISPGKNGELVAVPKIPDRMDAALALARMMGLDRTKLDITNDSNGCKTVDISDDNCGRMDNLRRLVEDFKRGNRE